MSVFRVVKAKGYTVMSNHHLRNHTLSLKAKGLLSQMLSLPEDWDYTLQGLAQINKESIDAIREAVRELERAGYIKRSRERDERGCLRGTVYTIYEQPHAEPTPEEPTQEKPALDNPTLEKPIPRVSCIRVGPCYGNGNSHNITGVGCIFTLTEIFCDRNDSWGSKRLSLNSKGEM